MNNNDDILKLLETIAKNYIKLNNNLNIELNKLPKSSISPQDSKTLELIDSYLNLFIIDNNKQKKIVETIQNNIKKIKSDNCEHDFENFSSMYQKTFTCSKCFLTI